MLLYQLHLAIRGQELDLESLAQRQWFHRMGLYGSEYYLCLLHPGTGWQDGGRCHGDADDTVWHASTAKWGVHGNRYQGVFSI